MKKRLLLGLLLNSSLVFAAPYVFSPGSTLTTGPSSQPHSLQSVTHNPASGSIILDIKENVRFGYFSGIGGGLEYGDVKNFEDDLNDLIDTIDSTDTTLDEAEGVLDRFNGVLPTLGEEGYLKLESRVTLPIFPLVTRIQALDGEVSINMALDTQLKASLLDAPLDYNSSTGTFDTNSAVYIKSGLLSQFAAGFSRSVWSDNVGKSRGNLIAGIRVNLYSLKLSKQVIALSALDGDEIGDILKDEYENNQVSTTGLGLDFGLLWVATKYQVGFTLTNINEPGFEYGIIGVGCEDISNAVSIDNCSVARVHIESLKHISASEVHVMNALGTVDASYRLLDNWAVSTSYEMARYNDLVGDENQWISVSSSYYPQSTLVPASRLGYRTNMVGSKISSVLLGTTLFKIFNLDMEWALDTTTVDDSNAPRSLSFSVGFEERF